ncbi:MAG: hypothetical protein JWO98_312 [Frankiales bacterium]|nr:hypothetical protein [Frankiales bacterium]
MTCNLDEMFRGRFTCAVPQIEVSTRMVPGEGAWLLYGGRVIANVPATAIITPLPGDADPLDFSVELQLDIVDGRLACVSLLAQRIDDGPTVTGEGLRRVPVADAVAAAAVTGDVLRERVQTGENQFSDIPFEFPETEFAKNGMTDDALEQVARIYAMAQATGKKATGILLSEYGMPRPTATRWIQAARRRGILKDEHERVPRPKEVSAEARMAYLNSLRAPRGDD